MDLVPVIYIENKEIKTSKTSECVSLKNFLKENKNNKKIYILDIDGIKQDKPNLCTYQRLAGFYDLWVDNGPRNIGDIVDTTLAGATNITLRKKLLSHLTILDIREITENKIFFKVDIHNAKQLYDSDGIVIFNKKENIELDFKLKEFFKNMIQKTEIYLYEPNLENQKFWKKLGASGLLVDLENIKDLKNGK